MMWEQEEQPDPTEDDIGKFLPKEDLLEWHRQMQKKHPRVFTPDDKLFGTDGAQHVLGTKLMTFFDDDPSKPIRLEVMGSRWMIEFGEKSPGYIVRHKGESGLSQIQLTSAHEEAGWSHGWDRVPPK
jgi:hypothetical protein